MRAARRLAVRPPQQSSSIRPFCRLDRSTENSEEIDDRSALISTLHPSRSLLIFRYQQRSPHNARYFSLFTREVKHARQSLSCELISSPHRAMRRHAKC